MTIVLATRQCNRRLTLARLRVVAAGLLAATGLVLVSAGSADASTVDGVATVTAPGTTTPLPSGASTAQFTVTLPPQAACTGDTATGGYHVFSYLVTKGTALSSVTYIAFPTAGYGFVNTLGTYYGPANTAISTGQIIGIPNDFEWAPLVTKDGVTLATLLYSGSGSSASGIWEAGLLCANSAGAVVDNWNTELTFSASSSDPTGFVWSAVPGVTTPTTTTTTSTTTTSTTMSTTTTTAPSSTTTSSDPTTTTTTTTAPVVGSAGATGGGGSSPSDVSASSAAPSSSPGTLASTGIHAAKGLGSGLLAIGVGLMLLGWGYRRKFRPARQAQD